MLAVWPDVVEEVKEVDDMFVSWVTGITISLEIR
jgi:hypothetical protein